MANPSAFEQLTLELINRFRSDPDGEFARLFPGGTAQANVQSNVNFFGVNLNALQTQLNALNPVAPLAWNSVLNNSATTHSQTMITHDQQSHRVTNAQGNFVEPSLGGRVAAAGYNNVQALAENIFAFTEDAIHGHAGFVVDWGYDNVDRNGAGQLLPNWQTLGDGIQDPPGHRNALISANYTEIGVGAINENNGATQVGPIVVTHNLGSRFNYQSQFVGVVINDADADNFYDIGEGLGGVTVTATGVGGTFTTTTWAAGGYQLVATPGTYTITFSGGGLPANVVKMATIGNSNVKVDAIAVPGAANPTPGDDNLTGTAGNDNVNLLAGNDTYSGLAGNDFINGNLGDDILNGGAGEDTLWGGLGADAMTGGAGKDIYYVDNVGDTITEAVDGGTIDWVYSNITHTLAVNVEYLFLWGNNGIQGFGNSANNSIVGNANINVIAGAAGNDFLNGFLGNDQLWGGLGNDVLWGGQGVDSMHGGLNDDIYYVTDIGDTANEIAAGGYDKVLANISYNFGAHIEELNMYGSGNISSFGGVGDHRMIGNVGNNWLHGGAGEDFISGNLGNDTINGGFDADFLFGGAGQDRFVFDTALSGGNIDRVAGFNRNEDTIVLDNSVFSALTTGRLAALNFRNGSQALDGNDYIVYDRPTGALFYDADGNGAQAAVQFATLTGSPVLGSVDFDVI